MTSTVETHGRWSWEN